MSETSGDEVVDRSTGPHGVATATFDATRTYRYRLSRTWDPSGRRWRSSCSNPSTADADVLDPTVRRCVGFALAWGFGSLEVVNLFAFRATDPRDLVRADARSVRPTTGPSSTPPRRPTGWWWRGCTRRPPGPGRRRGRAAGHGSRPAAVPGDHPGRPSASPALRPRRPPSVGVETCLTRSYHPIRRRQAQAPATVGAIS